VLTVREGVDVDSWPTRIVVGVDGSPQSARALAAARELADRFGPSVRPVVALLDASSDLHEARLLASDVEELSGSAVDELVHAAEDADLLVVGSRGLTGIRALGSVSERVAHSARCPVLVVRDPQRS
jgi:nucleotide-binding universal stress UspA family protein